MAKIRTLEDAILGNRRSNDLKSNIQVSVMLVVCRQGPKNQ
jgi:hypothetical protein